ncbi:MAG: hypothetical protein ACFE8L_00295 [Candidatus Hodarchaeota archaeon]
MSEKKKPKYPTEIYLRSYPKIIFFWPLLVVSFFWWIIQLFSDEPVGWLGTVWMIVFFTNLFITAFDFSSTKFFVLILVVVIGLLLVAFFVLPNLAVDIDFGDFNLGLTEGFYLVTTIILALILGFVMLSARFDYWKLERNEIYHKSGIFSSAERFPVKSLRLKKEIPDVFEYFLLRAGSMTLLPGRADEVIYLPTVLNIKKKEEQIDWLLSHVSVEPDEIDS